MFGVPDVGDVMSFTWRSWQETQDEALAAQRRGEAEERCMGEIHADWFMATAREIDREMKELLRENQNVTHNEG